MVKNIHNCEKEEIIEMLNDAAKLWLAHDGLWFQQVEKNFGLEKAIELDIEAWRRFSPIEAKRIMQRLGLKPGGGVDALCKALEQRLYSHLNKQTIERVDDHTIVFTMTECRVQSAREKKNMDPFPCKPVGLVEYTTFASTIDSRFETRCLHCPPDQRKKDCACSWEFKLRD